MKTDFNDNNVSNDSISSIAAAVVYSSTPSKTVRHHKIAYKGAFRSISSGVPGNSSQVDNRVALNGLTLIILRQRRQRAK